MLDKPHILSFSPTCSIHVNSIKHKFSCKILYILYKNIFTIFRSKNVYLDLWTPAHLRLNWFQVVQNKSSSPFSSSLGSGESAHMRRLD